MAGAKAVVAHRRAEPGDDLIFDLLQTQAEDGDRLTDTELVTLVWHLVLAGQTPTNLIANAVETLLTHPGQAAALRRDPDLMPRAVEELTRWSGPQLMTIPRYAREDVEIAGVRVGKGEPVTAVIAAANRDPRAFDHPEQLDLSRPRRHVGPPRLRPRAALLPRRGPGPDPDGGGADPAAASLPRSRTRRFGDPAGSDARPGHLAPRGATRHPLTGIRSRSDQQAVAL